MPRFPPVLAFVAVVVLVAVLAPALASGYQATETDEAVTNDTVMVDYNDRTELEGDGKDYRDETVVYNNSTLVAGFDYELNSSGYIVWNNTSSTEAGGSANASYTYTVVDENAQAIRQVLALPAQWAGLIVLVAGVLAVLAVVGRFT